MTTTGILPGVGPAGPLARTRSGPPATHRPVSGPNLPRTDGARLVSTHILRTDRVEWYFCCAVHIKGHSFLYRQIIWKCSYLINYAVRGTLYTEYNPPYKPAKRLDADWIHVMTQSVLSVDIYHVPRISQDMVGAAGLPLDSFRRGWNGIFGGNAGGYRPQGILGIDVSGTIRM